MRKTGNPGSTMIIKMAIAIRTLTVVVDDKTIIIGKEDDMTKSKADKGKKSTKNKMVVLNLLQKTLPIS